jgi:1-deoxyxylulose-5-phosphate synthase
MKYTHLGNSGLVVSRIALGCMNYGRKRWRPWMLEEDEARENFVCAIEHGVNFFDQFRFITSWSIAKRSAR